jgi:hypothetical protein
MLKEMGLPYTNEEGWEIYLDDTFESHCKCLGETLSTPWLVSTSKGRTFKDRSEVPWKEIKKRSEEYKLAMANNDPVRYATEKEIKKFRFGIF